MANANDFQSPPDDVRQLHALLHPPEVVPGVHPEEPHPDEPPAQDPHDDEDDREERDGHDGADEPRGDEEFPGLDRHGVESHDDAADPQDPDLRGHRGARPADDHQGRQDGTELPDEGEGDDRPEKPLGPEFLEGVEPLHREDHPREGCREDDDEERLDADEVDLLDDLPGAVRTHETLRDGLEQEEPRFPEEVDSPEGARPDPLEDVPHLPGFYHDCPSPWTGIATGRIQRRRNDRETYNDATREAPVASRERGCR